MGSVAILSLSRWWAGRMVSVVVLAFRNRRGADALAALLRDCGIPAAAVPEEDTRFPEGMAWKVRVPEADARRARVIVRALMRP